MNENDAIKDENAIGTLIRQKRKQLGLTADELAEKIGINRATIYRYENGDISKIPFLVAIDLAKLLNMELAAFVPGGRSNTFHVPFHDYPAALTDHFSDSLFSNESLQRIPLLTLSDKFLGKYAGDESIFFMKVSDNSMDRMFPEGTSIAVKQNVSTDSLKNGEIVVISYHKKHLVRRYFKDLENQRFIFNPDSTDPSYTPMVVSFSNSLDVAIVGKVVMYSAIL